MATHGKKSPLEGLCRTSMSHSQHDGAVILSWVWRNFEVASNQKCGIIVLEYSKTVVLQQPVGG